MFRSLSRTASATVVVLMLVLSSVPAAQASPLGFSGPSLDRAGWFDAALTWLDRLLFGSDAAPQKQYRSVHEAAIIPFDPEGGGGVINSGSCIDPGGRPRPCGF